MRGERANLPSDISSFDCVLYEMLAGRRAFARKTAVQTMAAILEVEPLELAGAEREFQRAIELDPDYPTAHHWYAVYLSTAGRSEQAIASLKRAQQLDPLSLIINADVGLQLHFARRYDEAIEQVRKALEMDPTFAAGHRPLGMAYEQKGMYPEAIAEFQKALDVSRGNPFALGSLGHAYAVSGNREKARQALSDEGRSPVRPPARRPAVRQFAAAHGAAAVIGVSAQ